MVGELGPGPVQPGLDGPDRPSDRLGDLFVGQVLFVEEGEHQAILGPEPVEGPLELAGQVVGIGQPGPVVDAILG